MGISVLVLAAAGIAACAPSSSQGVAAVAKGSGPTSSPRTAMTFDPGTASHSTGAVRAQPNVSSQTLLGAIDVRPGDAPSGYNVHLYEQGDQVVGQVSLDLCNADYPSEDLRVARRQVAVDDAENNELLSTEAILYSSAQATQQAFSELRAAAADCPPAFTPPAVEGEPPTKTIFNPPPDGGWPAVPGVDRLAFDVTVSDQQGETGRTIVVYLRRGPILLGVYFSSDNPPPVPIAGQHTIADVVNVLAMRLAAVPSEPPSAL